jgi:hypothetical protein
MQAEGKKIFFGQCSLCKMKQQFPICLLPLGFDDVLVCGECASCDKSRSQTFVADSFRPKKTHKAKMK